MIPTCILSPEEKELQTKKDELSSLEQQLTEKELLLSTLKGELNQFEGQYNRIVGLKNAELDEVRAQILELSYRLDPDREDIHFETESAWDHARHSSEQTGWTPEETHPSDEYRFQPSEELKKLFREVAKKIHPDLAIQERDRDRRHHLMSELNKAYDSLDENRIRDILNEWESGKPVEDHSGIGLQLALSVRKIIQIKARLERIEDELREIENSEMYRLKERIERERRNGLDIMQEMVADIDNKIIWIKTRIRQFADELVYL